MKQEELAQLIYQDARRMKETERHYEALVRAMNSSHVDGVQDALCVFEAIAMLAGQVIANFDEVGREGAMKYVSARAIAHAPSFLKAAKAATHLVVRDTDL